MICSSLGLVLNRQFVEPLLAKCTFVNLTVPYIPKVPQMGAQEPTVSVEFEVFGHVQGVYFTKYCKELCEQMNIGGWIKNTKKGTIQGKLQGSRSSVEYLVDWLSTTGSPGSKVEKCELQNWQNLTKPDFKGFSIRF